MEFASDRKERCWLFFQNFNTLQPPLESEGMKKERNGLIEKLENALQLRLFLVLNYPPHFKAKTLWHPAKF